MSLINFINRNGIKFTVVIGIAALFIFFINTVIFSKNYDLNIISADCVDSLPKEGKSLVIVAKIENSYHIRVFDRNGEEKVDRGKNKFLPSEELTKKLNSVLESQLSGQEINPEERNKLLEKIKLNLSYSSSKPDANKLILDSTQVIYSVAGVVSGIFSLLLVLLTKSDASIWGQVSDFRIYIAVGAFYELVNSIVFWLKYFNLVN